MTKRAENSSLAGDRKSRFFYGYVVVLAGFVIWLVAWGAYMTFGVFFKPLLGEFGWSRAMLSGAQTLSQIVIGTTGIVTGWLTDRLGPRLLVIAGGLFLGLGFWSISHISALWQFYLVFGVVISIGMGTTVIPIMSTVARWFVERRGLMTGIVHTGAGLGGVIMPPLAGWLILNYGWRHSYIVLGIIVLIPIILAAQFLRRDPGQIGQLPYGEGKVRVDATSLTAKGFSLREAIHFQQLWMLWIVFFCIGFVRSTILVHIAPYATDLGFSLMVGATVVSVISGTSVLGRVVFGRLGDIIGNRLTLIISFSLVALILFWVVVAKQLWMLYLFAAIFGLSWGSLAVLRFSVTSEFFGLGSLGLILGIVEFGASVGGASGPFLSGWIFDVTHSYFSAFLITGGVAITGLLLSWLLRPISNDRAEVELDE